MTARGWVLREGYPFILPPLLVGVAGYGLGWPVLGTFGLSIALGVALFFRNPTRRPPMLERTALAPADGKVIAIARVQNPEAGGDLVWKISIFMSVFNVHVNRSPVPGEVQTVRHEPGAFHPAYRGETSSHNERNIVDIRMNEGRNVTCVQVAGVLARRIVCWVREGAILSIGEPFGMIRFGSRVDCYFPLDFQPDVRVGEHARGGETVLGYFNGKPNGNG